MRTNNGLKLAGQNANGGGRLKLKKASAELRSIERDLADIKMQSKELNQSINEGLSLRGNLRHEIRRLDDRRSDLESKLNQSADIETSPNRTRKDIPVAPSYREQRGTHEETAQPVAPSYHEQRGTHEENTQPSALTNREKKSIQEEITQLDASIDDLASERDALTRDIDYSKAQLTELRIKEGALKRQRGNLIGQRKRSVQLAGNIGGFGSGVKGISKEVVGGLEKANPLNKRVNKEDVSDTGVESLRLAYTSTKKTAGTVKGTARTIKASVRTIKGTVSSVKSAGRTTFRVARRTVRIAVTVGRFAVTAVSHLMAFMMNPLVLFAAGLLIILCVFAGGAVTLLGGSAATYITNMEVTELGNDPERYEEGAWFLGLSKVNLQLQFNGWVDGVAYDADTLSDNPLIKLTIVDAGTNTLYASDYATDLRKSALKNTWSWKEDDLTDNMMLSIAYVLLQKEKNISEGTENKIYEDVSYTQELIDRVVAAALTQTCTDTSSELCPEENCTYVDPDYTCNGHSVVAITLSYRTSEELMDALGFSAWEKGYAAHTLSGFDGGLSVRPDISIATPFATEWASNITSDFGWRIHPIDKDANFHTGVDIAFAEGTNILAVQGGTVTIAEESGDYGNFVSIQHENGLVSQYAHCKDILVTVGQAVDEGTVIATVGNTGASTGPHLHLELLLDGKELNPLMYIQ